MRISDWSSDVCSSDLLEERDGLEVGVAAVDVGRPLPVLAGVVEVEHRRDGVHPQAVDVQLAEPEEGVGDEEVPHLVATVVERSEEHTSELQSLMRISYADFCLKNKTHTKRNAQTNNNQRTQY